MGLWIRNVLMNLKGVSKTAGVLLAGCKHPAIITFCFIVCLLLSFIKPFKIHQESEAQFSRLWACFPIRLKSQRHQTLAEVPGLSAAISRPSSGCLAPASQTPSASQTGSQPRDPHLGQQPTKVSHVPQPEGEFQWFFQGALKLSCWKSNFQPHLWLCVRHKEGMQWQTGELLLCLHSWFLMPWARWCSWTHRAHGKRGTACATPGTCEKQAKKDICKGIAGLYKHTI